MRVAAALLLLLSAACAGLGGHRSPVSGPHAGVAMGALPGIWRVVQVNGRNVPVPSPGEPRIIIEHASLLLTEAGDYTLTIGSSAGDGPVSDVTQQGRWRADATTITTTPENAAATSFTYQLSGQTLTLHDPRGVVYTLTRG